ncbi:glycosyltransferase involved in cell wall biosynthesis [Lysinibacillus parviboronicapiens]|uniref:Glycosyltransferase involved in cell wall biosynthesis n=1 Tax=Lysinibacillus parviboronicapiens TaxID=436516 RepID=A0ABV2PID3_9BACI
MNNGPKISIITACYNAENTIEQTIQSVLGQTYENIEYIIVDGASTDGTMEIVEKYRDKIDVVVSESDKGVYDAFNKGVGLATGDFINFMNADDYFSTNAIIERIALYLVNHSHVMLLHGNVKAIDEITGHWHYRGQSLSLRDFEKGQMCPHQSVFTRRELFNEFEGFNLAYKILADVDFTIKTFKKYEEYIEYVPIEVAHFRLGGLSSSLQHEKNMHYENAIIHFNHFGNIPDYVKYSLENFETSHINSTYQLWLESFIFEKKRLENLNNLRIVIFGTKKNATYLYHDLRGKGLEVVCFLDNDERMHNQLLHDIPINSPSILNEAGVDVIIISIERFDVAQSIKKQLQQRFKHLKICTWHELV